MSKARLSVVADIADNGYLIGESYDDYDCQGYLKAVLRKAGCTRQETTWRGTNDIYRNRLTELHEINEGPIPEGAVLLTVKDDGGQPNYYESGPNCSHCGIYINPEIYTHSTKGGVQYGNTFSRWTHWAILDCMEQDGDATHSVLSPILSVRRGGGERVEVDHIKIIFKNPDGTEDYEDLELNDVYDLVSMEAYKSSAG